MKIEDIIGQKFGLTHDRYMAKYHRWAWDQLPLRLPACEIHCQQTDAVGGEAVVRWEIEDGVPIVCRLDDEDGRIRAEVLPCGAPEAPGVPRFSKTTHRIAHTHLAGGMGFAFEWVFSIPVKPAGQYQPTHPLGIVLFDSGRLAGKETVLQIVRLAARSARSHGAPSGR
jgi:hypothetical protein